MGVGSVEMTLAIHHALRTSERATQAPQSVPPRHLRACHPGTSERATQSIGRLQTAPRLKVHCGTAGAWVAIATTSFFSHDILSGLFE